MKKQVNLALLLGGTLALVVVVVGGLTGLADEKTKRPTIKRLGTIDLLMVETTPVVFKDRLYRFEYVRDNYYANKTGASYFRFIDVATGKATPAFAKGLHLGCAFVEGDTVYAYGVDKWGGSKITLFRSQDMEKWEERLALHLPRWELFNASVCKADGRYVMAVEVGGPKDVVGVPFTIFFAESKDLLTWKLLPQEFVYSKEKYTACPALRYLDSYFYMLYLETRPGPTYETFIVRSKDLKRLGVEPPQPRDGVLGRGQENRQPEADGEPAQGHRPSQEHQQLRRGPVRV